MQAGIDGGVQHNAARIRFVGIGGEFPRFTEAAREFVELGFFPAILAPAYDLSATLPHDSGLGAALRALVGYSATPELSALLLQLGYLLIGLVFYLRPLRPVEQHRPVAQQRTEA